MDSPRLARLASVRVVKQYERGLIFRFGRVLDRVRGPGLTWMVPVADRLRKVNLQIVTMAVPAQEGITRDNVTVKVDAVVYFRVVDPVRAVVNVEDYPFAVSQVAQTSLRSVIGKSDLDDLLTNRERLNEGLELMIDNPAVEWGIHIDRVEIKDVALPETMKRSMSRQAEAERERRARIISADGEFQASGKLAQAAEAMAEYAWCPPASTPRDHRRGGRGEELHAGAAVPRRTVAVPRTQHEPPCADLLRTAIAARPTVEQPPTRNELKAPPAEVPAVTAAR